MQDTSIAEPALELLVEQPARSTALAEAHATALAVPQNSPAAMMLAARAQGFSLEQVGQMMDLQERWEKREAEKAFNDAMAAFKGEAVEIIKRKRVHFENSKGGTTDYKHAELSDVVEAVGPPLSKHGFSWRWDTKQDGSSVIVTCILKHRLGHSESCTLSGPYDQSGGKNAIQAIISAKTYLERQTLKAICGVAEKGEDNDGGGAAEPASGAAQEAQDPTLKAGWDAADKGMVTLTKWWGSLTPKQQKTYNNAFGQMRKNARDVDQGAGRG